MVNKLNDVKWFVGTVEKVSTENLSVKVMSRTGKKFRWPRTQNKETVLFDDVLSKVAQPPKKVVNEKGSVFMFDENEYKGLMMKFKEFKVLLKKKK